MTIDTFLSDERYMTCALLEARKAYAEGEIPVGAVVVCDGKVIGTGHNMTESLNDVTAHAEIIAITAAENYFGGKYLKDCTLYVTVEPCVMCAGAIGWSQLSRIVIGCADEKRGYTTYTSRSPFHPKATVTTGICADECRELMQNFFKDRRK
jgi:tRNA(adenine34) deaminase